MEGGSAIVFSDDSRAAHSSSRALLCLNLEATHRRRADTASYPQGPVNVRYQSVAGPFPRIERYVEGTKQASQVKFGACSVEMGNVGDRRYLASQTLASHA